ncbi:hypothetical protein C8R44DRAFT_729029 [Mycena epipterygia]|nr:hypothetical protein C8R44DRAFT_729029 [Mycena epipterygia]
MAMAGCNQIVWHATARNAGTQIFAFTSRAITCSNVCWMIREISKQDIASLRHLHHKFPCSTRNQGGNTSAQFPNFKPALNLHKENLTALPVFPLRSRILDFAIWISEREQLPLWLGSAGTRIWVVWMGKAKEARCSMKKEKSNTRGLLGANHRNVSAYSWQYKIRHVPNLFRPDDQDRDRFN